MERELGPAPLVALALAVWVAPALAQGTSDKEAILWNKMAARLETVDKGLDGVLGLSVKDLGTGRVFEIRPDESFPAASSIKLAVLLELYHEAADGKLILDEITRPGQGRVRGGGVLQELGDSVTLTWRDLAVLMIGWSDNEATNLLIDAVGLEAVNRGLDRLGLSSTRLRRRMMDTGAARAGRENVSTPAELRQLAEAVATGQGLPQTLAKDMRSVAAVPKQSPLRSPLPPGVTVIDKPGALEGVRCAAGVVDLPGRSYSLAVMTSYLRQDEDGDRAIAEVSQILHETFDRLARSSELGRVISDR